MVTDHTNYWYEEKHRLQYQITVHGKSKIAYYQCVTIMT